MAEPISSDVLIGNPGSRFAGRTVKWDKFVAICLMLTAVTPAQGSASSLQHGDPIAPVILTVTGILFFALLGRFVAAFEQTVQQTATFVSLFASIISIFLPPSFLVNH